MPRNLRFGIGSGLALILFIAIIFPLVNHQIGQWVEQLELRELRAQFERVTAQLHGEERLAAALADTIASLDWVAERFAAGDRETLQKELVPVFETLKKKYAVEQFQLHTPPATSFLRLHMPGKFGDDLSTFRPMVVLVNTSHQGVYGLEYGVAGLAVRGVAPVFHQGKQVGSVEFGMSVEQPLLAGAAGLEFALFVKERKFDDFKPFAKSYGDQGRLLSEEQLAWALRSPLHAEGRLGDKDKSIFADKITDYSGVPIGVLVVAIDRDFYETLAKSGDLFIGIGVIGLLMGLVIGIRAGAPNSAYPEAPPRGGAGSTVRRS